MTTGVTVTKGVREGYQKFGQFRAVICDIEITTAATYTTNKGVLVAPADFGLQSIAGAIFMGSARQANALVSILWNHTDKGFRMWIDETEENTNPTATTNFRAIVLGN